MARLLRIGYTTVDQAIAKGILNPAVPATIDLFNNYGEFFQDVLYFVPYGKADSKTQLSRTVRYEEIRFPATKRTIFGALSHLARARRRLQEIISEFKPDVVQICGPHIPAVAALVTPAVRRCKTVCFLEAYWEDIIAYQKYFPRKVRSLLPLWYRLVYRLFDIYIGAPSLTPEYYTSKGMARNRIARWVQEIDLRIIDAVAPADDPSLDGLQNPLICVVGRLHPEKLAKDAVEAFCAAAMRCAGALVVIGDGSEREELERMVVHAGLSDRVRFLGQLPSAMVVSIMKRCEVMIAPLQGTALLEALACGLAVVAYDNETHRAHIRDGENGRLVPNGGVSSAASVLAQLIEHEQERRRLGAAARRYVEENFSFDKMFDVMNDGFRKALALRK